MIFVGKTYLPVFQFTHPPPPKKKRRIVSEKRTQNRRISSLLVYFLYPVYILLYKASDTLHVPAREKLIID
jgi:hypothetical protein